MSRRIVVAFVVLLAYGCARDGSSTTDGGAVVDRIVDGDTLVADIGEGSERIRLIGVDTPESVKPNSPIECFGKEASAHLAELLPPGTAIRLERDVEARDRYDRLLAYVYRVEDGLFVNLAMAADGYAMVLTVPPNVAHAEDFAGAVARARVEGKGLWSSCDDVG
jgi:micrococcal nuclease